jgi:type IV pilus assembly protein PilA
VNKMLRKQSRKGFSLVELLAVVLVLAVLAAVAIPLYTSQRKSAAGRTCKANLAAISSSMSAYALRQNQYPTALVTLVGTAEGLTEVPKCPLGGTYSIAGGGLTGTVAQAVTVTCPSATDHVGFGGAASTEWVKTLAAPAGDSLP